MIGGALTVNRERSLKRTTIVVTRKNGKRILQARKISYEEYSDCATVGSSPLFCWRQSSVQLADVSFDIVGV